SREYPVHVIRTFAEDVGQVCSIRHQSAKCGERPGRGHRRKALTDRELHDLTEVLIYEGIPEDEKSLGPLLSNRSKRNSEIFRLAYLLGLKRQSCRLRSGLYLPRYRRKCRVSGIPKYGHSSHSRHGF